MNDADVPNFPIYGPPTRQRVCGACKACCTIVPVELPGGYKGHNVKCRHLVARGCSIYAHRPAVCHYWSCRWLFDPHTSNLKRPDHGGYIVDCMPDTILVNNARCAAIQVWIDPARRDAHHDRQLRAYLQGVGERHQMPAIIRFSSKESFVLVPPALTEDGKWLEIHGETLTRDQMAAKLDAVIADEDNQAL